MRLSDEKSLLEQITIEQARQNLALLKAEEIEMPKKWVIELLNTIEALQQENEQLQAQVARVREALRKARETISAWDRVNWFECDRCKNMRDALAAYEDSGLSPDEVHSPEGDYIKSCPECGGTGKRRITIQLQKYDMLKAELARYKQEAEKIPDICYRYRYDPDECVHNDECPKICPKRNGGRQG